MTVRRSGELVFLQLSKFGVVFFLFFYLCSRPFLRVFVSVGGEQIFTAMECTAAA